MSDVMKPLPFRTLLRWILKEYEANGSIFGIPRSQFYLPQADSPLVSQMFGQRLQTPIGPAAGPHTQMTQNIVSSWLTGGRFIELKTVQIMDTLEIPRPCIDMQDEGYNVEWSQELRLDESLQEYVNAWALVHLLPRLLGVESVPLGTIFNMSVGYNLEGIQSAPMTRFMDGMRDASALLAPIRTLLQDEFPQFAAVEIPDRLTNNVTLSTMHGCPPEEIERIARYLIEERGLHTTIKLNPTLLGKETVLSILNNSLGFHEIDIPDSVFEHDLRWERALALIRSLQGAAAERGVVFSVKLSNTLPIANHRRVLPGGEMYMSGRALFPLTVTLFDRLTREFGTNLNVSYSAGADALNVVDLLRAGARPITVASDLLKPGGYARLNQYLENLEAAMRQGGFSSLDALASSRLEVLPALAEQAVRDPRYHKDYHNPHPARVESGLDLFDCITAPCTSQCAVCQDVPEYNGLIAAGETNRALEVILSRNPMPGVTGYVCTHLCQTACIRSDYDQSVNIRMLKRYAVEKGQVQLPQVAPGAQRVAVIGAGPSGLAAAHFLALNGIGVTVFEAKDQPGGMLRLIPSFRLPDSVIAADIERIRSLGVEIRLNSPVTCPPEDLLQAGFDAVYLASGFQKNTPLKVEGVDGQGVYSALDLLERVRRGDAPDLGQTALVIGGGDTAMDAARVASRLTGQPARIVYRRTRQEMPASPEELAGALEEGVILDELLTPVRVVLEAGRVVALECRRNQLGEPGADGRRRPVEIPGSEFQIPASAVLLAIGQLPDLTFLDGSAVTLDRSGAVTVQPESGAAGPQRVYAGGDVVEGPESIIAACADGRRAAEAICRQLDLRFTSLPTRPLALTEADLLQVKTARARKVDPLQPNVLPVAARAGFDLIEGTLSDQAAQQEAARCLQCTSLCDKCVEVCPNRANLSFRTPALTLDLPRLEWVGGALVSVGSEPFRIEQSRQVLHLDEFCNECGNCATFCNHMGKPYREKPRLFLDRAEFERETDNAFFLEGDRLFRRTQESQSCLSLEDSGLVYETEQARLCLSPEDFSLEALEPKGEFSGALSLRPGAEMWVLLQALRSDLVYLTA